MVSAGGRSSGAVSSSLTSPFNINIQTASQIRKGLSYGVGTKKKEEEYFFSSKVFMHLSL